MRTRVFEHLWWSMEEGSASGMAFSNVTFKNCRLGPIPSSFVPGSWLEFSGCRFDGVRVEGGLTVSSTLLIDTVFRDVKVRGDIIALWGVGFRRCRLEGAIGRFNIFPSVFPTNLVHEARIEQDLQAFHAASDWCLDIRDAEFEEGNLYGVPASKVLIDPRDQMRIRRVDLTRCAWGEVDFENTAFNILLGDLERGFILGGVEDLVIFGERRSKMYSQQLRVLGRLRDLGLGTSPGD